jgi:hypothetical protein
MKSEILQPVAVLAAWSLVMWVWLYATRLPAMARARLDGMNMVGTTGPSLRDELIAKGEERASWVADNYNHLMEQPTVFYAVALVIAFTGTGDGLNATLAWAYVALRIAHSLVQVTFNRVVVRFALFMLGTLPLIALTLHALIAVFR